MQHNLFDVTRSIAFDGPRVANNDEIFAYAQWLRHSRGLPNFPGVTLRWHGGGRRSQAICIAVSFGGDAETGAYSLLLPGYNSHRQRVTMETLNEAGDVIASQTLPVEPKKGGVIWDRAAVRKACGPVEKPAKALTPTADKPAISKGAISRGKKALEMLTGDKPGMGRRALDNCFEMGDGAAVSAVIEARLAEDRELARRVFYGRRTYRAAYPGDYPETHHADHFLTPEWLAAIVRHGDVQLGSISNLYGMRDKVAELLGEVAEPIADAAPAAPEPVQAQEEASAVDTDTPEPLDALHGAPAGEIEAVEPVQEMHKLPEPAPEASEPDLAETVRAMLARIEAIEAALSAKAPEPASAAPIAEQAQATRQARSPAYERAVRRAWAERKARRGAQGGMAIHARRVEVLERELRLSKDEQALDKQALAEVYARAEQFARRGNQHRDRRLASVRRARRMLAAVRERADLDRRALAATNIALANLKQSLADPTQPERASDIARLMQERDQARTSLAAVSARAERQQAALDALAGQFEAMVSRVTRAEAAMRQAGLIAAA